MTPACGGSSIFGKNEIRLDRKKWPPPEGGGRRSILSGPGPTLPSGSPPPGDVSGRGWRNRGIGSYHPPASVCGGWTDYGESSVRRRGQGMRPRSGRGRLEVGGRSSSPRPGGVQPAPEGSHTLGHSRAAVFRMQRAALRTTMGCGIAAFHGPSGRGEVQCPSSMTDVINYQKRTPGFTLPSRPCQEAT